MFLSFFDLQDLTHAHITEQYFYVFYLKNKISTLSNIITFLVSIGELDMEIANESKLEQWERDLIHVTVTYLLRCTRTHVFVAAVCIVMLANSQEKANKAIVVIIISFG